MTNFSDLFYRTKNYFMFLMLFLVQDRIPSYCSYCLNSSHHPGKVRCHQNFTFQEANHLTLFSISTDTYTAKKIMLNSWVWDMGALKETNATASIRDITRFSPATNTYSSEHQTFRKDNKQTLSNKKTNTKSYFGLFVARVIVFFPPSIIADFYLTTKMLRSTDQLLAGMPQPWWIFHMNSIVVCPGGASANGAMRGENTGLESTDRNPLFQGAQEENQAISLNDENIFLFFVCS